MDCRLDHTNVRVGEVKSLTSARNETGDIASQNVLFGPIFIAYCKTIFYKHAICIHSVRHENDIVKCNLTYITQKELRIEDCTS